MKLDIYSYMNGDAYNWSVGSAWTCAMDRAWSYNLINTRLDEVKLTISKWRTILELAVVTFTVSLFI